MRYRSIPAAEAVLYGVKPVVVAVVLQAIWGLGRTGISTRRLFLVAVLALAANALGMNELLAVSGPLVARIRRSPALSAFLDGVIAASLSLMALVAFELAKGSLVDLGSFLILLASAVALLRFRVSSSWLILSGGLVSVLARSLG